MASGSLRTLLRLMRKVASPGEDDSPDGELLRRFVERRDESAFAALVERHGPLVLGVCRRILGNRDDADDAFQAVFLVLACKARSIAHPSMIGSWLFRVAYRVAGRARALSAARRDRQPLTADVSVYPRSDVDWTDVRPILDEEITRLPEKYRAPVVLCYLQGFSYDEAARRLGCAKGTICSRLASARERLRARLTHRDVTLSAAGFASVLTASVLSAEVPASLATNTIQTSLSFVLGTALPGSAPTSGIALARGVLRAMFIARVRTVMVLLLALVLAGTGAGYFMSRSWAAAQPQRPVEERAIDKPVVQKPADEKGKPADNSRLNELLKKRRDAAQVNFDGLKQFMLDRVWYADSPLFHAATRLLESELELCKNREEQIKACESHLLRMKDLEARNDAQLAVGKVMIADAALSQYYRLDAEIRLERAKK